MTVLQPAEFRNRVRTGQFTSQTAGQCPGYTQGNLAILPRDYAEEFLRFCRLNPKPCPVIGVTEVGDPSVPELGEGIDLRTDVPGYCVFRDGELVEEVADLRALWRDDLVGFVIGCSLSFEEALMEGGLPVRHIEQGSTVPMYNTSNANRPAGRFGGNGVVSMRPMTAAQAIRAVQITSRFPGVHGAPVHLGDPAQIGIADIDSPDYGERAEIRPGEIPVFWACGVTPQQAIRSARPPFAITHKPGHMLVTDVRNSHLAVL
ncbi:putative hydro-lyase [Xylophilus sp. GW821-FHT01B05]